MDLASNTARQQPAVFMLMMRPLSNSLNCEKCLLTRLPGILRLLKSSSNRNVIVTFMSLPLCDGLYSAHFLISALLQDVWSCALEPNLDHLRIGSLCSYLRSFTIAPFFLLGALFSMHLCVYCLKLSNKPNAIFKKTCQT
ncbi:hypothetical protein AVEN_221670-1 [Araneus ventricosus]|uniref:Uncharacterized protein n=1 Tax=Araneus ventricosus TaxID=182803 RepID=A0A4Y2IQY7_ARAVE|nr:hypothetical protein AVEN_231502-1 [Araneus ventricosus]GBM80263.1 hypothetical protein AVEN_237121-1 [Araneus ventricosus]GBM80305.1 hypothetical protein AVEN_90500-1 [Araneus ventricosus]GBM80349.1 hypothetical protein AVEN_221670-1 [Araneus ventricosus]